MKIEWSESAKEQMKAIKLYIGQHSEEYAELTCRKIMKRIERIADFPMMGRVVPEYDHQSIGEVIESPYGIFYHIQPARIEILAVVHGRQDLTTE